MQETKQSCPVCLNTLKTAKPDTVLVCSNCNISLFAYEDRQKQVKVMPFQLGIQFKKPNNTWEDAEDDFDEDFAPDETSLKKNF